MTVTNRLLTLATMVKRDGWKRTVRLSSLRLSERMAERQSWADFGLPLREDDVADSLEVAMHRV